MAGAAIQGAVFGLVKAAVERSGARAFEKVTGSWPGSYAEHSGSLTAFAGLRQHVG